MKSPLVRLNGTVSDLLIYAGEEEFVRSPTQQSVALGAAAGLAVSGLAGAAVGASMAATASDAVEYFEFKLNGHPVSGRFSKASFENGDSLTVVAEPKPAGGGFVLAAWRARDRKLWMAPHCSRGTRAHARFCVKMFAFLFLALLVLLGGAFALMDVLSSEPITADFRYFWMGLVSGLALLMSAYYSWRFYRQWLPLARLSDAIFAAFGRSNPADTNLPRDHEAYCKELGVKWPYPTEGPWIFHAAMEHAEGK